MQLVFMEHYRPDSVISSRHTKATVNNAKVTPLTPRHVSRDAAMASLTAPEVTNVSQ